MDTYIARQPIFTAHKKIYAYELLFRNGLENVFPQIDGDAATSRLLSGSFLGAGIEPYTSGLPAFVNFTRNLLVQKIPTIFSPAEVVVEVLEEIAPEPDVLAACRAISSQGFTLALDDFVDRPGLAPLLDLAGIIKIDVLRTPLDTVEKLVRRLRSSGRIILLAEKVETPEIFQQAREMGFTYFQGYFFSKPEVLQKKDIAPAKLNYLQLIFEVHKSQVDFDRLERIIRQDVSISYKLLRYINSPYFRRIQEVTSIRKALVLLGEQEIKKFISLIALSNVSDDKPNELIKSAIFRARFCENIGRTAGREPGDSKFFLLGLFSLIDAMLDDSMENIMQQLPLSEDIKQALVDNGGLLSKYLTVVKGCEKGDWESCLPTDESLQIKESKLPDYYLDALNLADAYGKS